MVSAWSTSNELVLGQFKTEEKSNEIIAIPVLLKMLSIEKCLVTIDAMGRQKKIAKAIREHWHAENKLHWVLDVVFREDESRLRKGHGAKNFSMLRRMALSLLKKEKTDKTGTETKRLRAGWDNNYLKPCSLECFHRAIALIRMPGGVGRGMS